MRKAGDIISAMFKEQFGEEFMQNARATAGLFSSWTKIVIEAWGEGDGKLPGSLPDSLPPAAGHSRIRELERGLLLIEADHPGWIQILQTKQKELLLAVKRRYPEMNVRNIAFRLSRHNPPAATTATVAAVPPVPADAPAAASAETFTDRQPDCKNKKPAGSPELYAALKSLKATVKKRNRM